MRTALTPSKRALDRAALRHNDRKETHDMIRQPTEAPVPYERIGALRFLNPEAVSRIDQALQEVGEFGEVTLIVMKGRLRFIQITQSEKLDDSES
jgi:hypothetical protein